MEEARTASVSTAPVDVSRRHSLSSPPQPFAGAVSAVSEAPDDPRYQQHPAWSMYLLWHVPWARCKKLLWRASAGATDGLARVGDRRAGGTADHKPGLWPTPVGTVFQAPGNLPERTPSLLETGDSNGDHQASTPPMGQER